MIRKRLALLSRNLQQPDTWSAAVLVDEFDAGRVQTMPSEGGRSSVSCQAFTSRRSTVWFGLRQTDPYALHLIAVDEADAGVF